MPAPFAIGFYSRAKKKRKKRKINSTKILSRLDNLPSRWPLINIHLTRGVLARAIQSIEFFSFGSPIEYQ